MEVLNVVDGVKRLLEQFGRLVIYRKLQNNAVVDRLVKACMSMRTRTAGRLEPYELVTAGLSDKTGYTVLIENVYGFIPSIDDLIIVPQAEHDKLTQPLVILECLRVTNVMDVFYQQQTIAYQLYCIRDDKLRGAMLARS